MYTNSRTKALSLQVSSIVRDILIRCIFDFADRSNIEIQKVLVSNEHCLNCRIIKKIFTNNVLINLSFCYKIILTLGPKQHLTPPNKSLAACKDWYMSQYVFNRAKKYYSFKLDCIDFPFFKPRYRYNHMVQPYWAASWPNTKQYCPPGTTEKNEGCMH